MDKLLPRFVQIPGVLGCAVVDANHGMVLHHVGELPDMVQIGEAAVEFWRLYDRLNTYFSSDFGEMEIQTCFFQQRVLVLAPWNALQRELLICVGQKAQVNWAQLRAAITQSRQREMKSLNP
jgi:hypothetical protein